MMHASCRVNTAAKASCADVRAEMLARVAGQYDSWHDPHNNGTYKLLDAAPAPTDASATTHLTFSRLTGDKRYTDKMRFILTPTHPPSGAKGEMCSISGCSQSQVFSVADFSTNYCNLRMLYCGHAEGCSPVSHPFTMTEFKVDPSFGAGSSLSDCFKGAAGEAARKKAGLSDPGAAIAAEMPPDALSDAQLADEQPRVDHWCEPEHRLVDPSPLIDFRNRDECEAWTTIDDRIMGGSSRSKVHYMGAATIAGTTVKPTCRFEGELVTEGGGFASARWVPENWMEQKMRLKGKSGLILRAKGDGRAGYKMSVYTEFALANRVAYQQALFPPWGFAAHQDGEEIEILEESLLPFADFVGRAHGKKPARGAPPLASEQVRQLGLQLSRFPPFSRPSAELVWVPNDFRPEDHDDDEDEGGEGEGGVESIDGDPFVMPDDDVAALVDPGTFWLQLETLHAYRCVVGETEAVAAEFRSANEEFLSDFQENVRHWWLGQTMGTQVNLGHCLGGLGTSLASQLEHKLRMAKCAVGDKSSCDGGGAGGGKEGGGSRPGCEYEHLKEKLGFPDFPDFPNPFKFEMPPLPALPGRLLPKEMLVYGGGGGYRVTHAIEQPVGVSAAASVGISLAAGVGSAGALLAVASACRMASKSKRFGGKGPRGGHLGVRHVASSSSSSPVVMSD